MAVSRKDKEVGANQLVKFMNIRGYNANSFSIKCGVPSATIRDIMIEKADFRISTAIKLAKGLNISLDALVGRDEFSVKKLEDIRALSDKLANLVW